MGLLDYYRQFEELSEEEERQELARRAAERKRLELERASDLDLSQTYWPELPHPAVVQALTHAARSALQRYPDATALRRLLAERNGVGPSQVVVGPGASYLLAGAARLLFGAGDRLVVPWPTYPLLARLGVEQGVVVEPVAIKGPALGEEAASLVDQLLAAAPASVKGVALASPNDPTGELVGTAALERLATGLAEGCWLFLDESLVEYAQEQPSSQSLLARFPRLLIFRTFSKAYGLAGLRIGYLLCSEPASRTLAELEPPLGVNGLSLAGAIEAIESLDGVLAQRRRQVGAERRFLAAQLRRRGFAVQEGEGPFLWVSHPRAAAVAAALAQRKVTVAKGEGLGFPSQLRISCFERASSLRFLEVLDGVLERQPSVQEGR